MLNKESKRPKGVSGGKVKIVKQGPPHTKWEFKPKLENEAVVLHSLLSIYDIPYYREIVDDVRDLITQLVRNHGFRDGSERYKIIKDYTVSLIEGRNPDNPGWLATSRVHRIPSKLGENFIQLIADYLTLQEPSIRPKYYQAINTILNIVRMVDGLVDADLKSVTDKAKPIDQKLLDEFSDYVKGSLENIKPIDNNINLFNVRFNLKKKGPNGQPKIESSIQEAVALLNSKLARPFKVICQELKCEYLYEYLTHLTSKTSNSVENSDDKIQSNTGPTTKLRVLVGIPDSGFKTRLVAIVDFWSQLILEPVRARVQEVIEIKFGKTDFRKNQDLGVTKMVEFQKRCLQNDVIMLKGESIKLDVKHLKCYDISAWTDRFHRDLQKIVMKHLFSPRMSEAWAQLVVHCEWYHPKSRSTIKYGQGQGMGTNGSFDIATLTDHLCINFVIDRFTSYSGYFPNNECYGKVGDDLWIYDPENHIRKFYEDINLPINFSKSKEFVGQDSIVEFCARTFLNSEDVSRISPKIISRSKDFRYIPTLLGLCSSRGIQLDATSFRTLNNIVKGSDLTYLDKLQDWIVGMLLIGQYEESPYFRSITEQYLELGNWLTESSIVRRMIQDTKLLCRIMIAHSICEITANLEAFEDLLFETVDVMDQYGDEITRLTNSDTNLFDISTDMHKYLLDTMKVEYVTPKQIIVLGRYVDQRNNVQGSLQEANEEVEFADDINAIVNYARRLAKIAHSSCYDEGNINYNTDRVIGTQYKIVKTLSYMEQDYTVLKFLTGSQLRKIWQNLPYDEIASKWEGYCPILEVI